MLKWLPKLQTRGGKREGAAASFGIMTKVSHANILQNFHFHRQVKRTEAAANKTLHSVYISNSSRPRPSARFDFYLFSKLHSNHCCSSSLPLCERVAAGSPEVSSVIECGRSQHLSLKLLILLAIVREVIQVEGEGGSDSCSIFNHRMKQEKRERYPAYLFPFNSIPHGTKWEFNTGIIHNGRTQYNISNSTIRQVS